MNGKPLCFKGCVANGICGENPIFRLMLGLCPTLAITVTVVNGIGMGIAATFVLLGSNIIIALIKDVVPPQVRLPCYILVIATFVTIVKMVMQAYLPALYDKMGLFVDIMVVNCIILGRAEAFASKNTVRLSIADALGMGCGFTLAIVAISSIREILGSGTWFGLPLVGASVSPVLAMILPPGAFLTIGVLMALMNYWQSRARRSAQTKGVEHAY